MLTQVLDPVSYTLSVYSIPTAITMLSVLVLGVLVLVRERLSLVSISFSLLSLSLAFWFFCFTITYSSVNESAAFFWARLSLIGVSLLPPATFGFTVTVLHIDRYKTLVLLNWLVGLFLAATGIFTDAITDGTYHYWWGYYLRFNWAGSVFVVFLIGILTADLVLFLNAYSTARPGVHKQRIRAFMLAFCVGYIGAVDLFATIGIPLYPFGYLPVFGFVVVAALTIWLYHLVDITPAFAAPQIIDTMEGALLVLDSEGIIRVVNSATSALFGKSREGLVGKPAGSVLDDPLFTGQLDVLFRNGGLKNHVLHHHAGDEDRLLSLTASVMRQEGAPVAVVCVVHDITDQQRAEEQVRRQNEYLSALHETSLSLMNRLNLTELLEDIIMRAASLANTEHGYIYLVLPDEDELVVHTGVGLFSKYVGERLKYGTGLAGRVWQKGVPLTVDDYAAWSGQDQRYSSTGFHATVGVPLKSGAATLGVIGLAYTDMGRKFGPAEMELLDRFAQLASIALDNARLYSAAQQELAERTAAEEQVRMLNEELEQRVLERTAQLQAANVDLAAEVSVRKRAEEERTRLLERERIRAKQLRQLAEASVSINSAHTLDDMLRIVTEQARLIIGANQAMTSLAAGITKPGLTAVSFSDGQCAPGVTSMDSGADLEALVRDALAPVRLNHEALEHHPAWGGPAMDGTGKPPLRGWLAAPLTRYDGRYLGAIQLSDKAEGDFTEQDESILVQLAQAASVAVENARLYREAQEAVTAREGLLSIVSHDLGNPLSVIKGSTRLLRRKVAAADPQVVEAVKPGLDRVENATDRMAGLINELLDFARVQAGQQLNLDLRATDLVALVRHVAGSHDGTTERHRIHVEVNVPTLVGAWDTTRLERVLDNLLSNAIKYSPLGGDIVLTIDRVDGAAGHAGWAVLRVKDDGMGIPPADVPHIFEWFHRAQSTSRRVSGTGIGLASARQIVEQHGGTISVTSKEGQGSTFTVHLPLTRFEDIDVSQTSAP